MNGELLYNLTTGLNAGRPLDITLFYQLLNMAKGIREMSRDWMVLRAEDTSKTFTSADTYTSTKTLPDRFLRTYSFTDSYGQQISGAFILESNGQKRPLAPIKFEQRFDYKDTDGYYYIDLKNNAIGRTGSLSGTLHLFFLQGTVDINASGTWDFPTYAHPLLAYDVAVLNKGGIDWDTVNQSQVPFNAQTIRQLESSLNMWDARLQQSILGV